MLADLWALTGPAALAVLLGATVQSATGFGFALISGPVLFTVRPAAEAVTTLLVLGTASNLLVLAASGRGGAVRWKDVRSVLLAALPGLVAGGLLLGVLPKPVLQIALGIGVLAAVLLQARPRSPLPADAPGPTAPGRSAAGIGLTVGVLTTATGTNGPPLVLWLERRRAAPAEARSTIAAIFLGLNVLGALTLAALGHGSGGLRPGPLGVLLVAAVAGHLAGSLVFRRLGSEHFRIAGLILCAVAGIAAIVGALIG